jgi:hypothetical protein
MLRRLTLKRAAAQATPAAPTTSITPEDNLQNDTVCDPDWQILSDTWSSDEAQAYLAAPPPKAISDSDTLRHLLATTRRIVAACPVPITEPALAFEAIRCQAFLTLVRLVHWLQQRPQDMATGDSLTSDWCLYVKALLAISGAVNEAVEPAAKAPQQPPSLAGKHLLRGIL